MNIILLVERYFSSGLFLLSAFWGFSFSAEASVYISEFMASNATGLQDESGDRPDWIEVHNGGSDAVNLAGWTLRDGPKNSWRFPDFVLEPNGYLVVFASGENRRDGQPFHTNFELKRSGELLQLVAPGSVGTLPVDPYPVQRADVSYGVIGNEHRYFSNPSPGAQNVTEGSTGMLDCPIGYSRLTGWFDEPFEVGLTGFAGGTEVFYTIDGSVPTRESGVRYVEPIGIESMTVLRVAAYCGEHFPPTLSTFTYLHAPSVVSQSRPADYPEYWAEDIAGDYSVSLDEDDLVDALKALPVVSLVMDAGDLFGGEHGIYLNSERDGVEWERGVSFEFIGDDGFQVDAGIRIQGRSSRQPRTSPKHSFRVLFKHPYGPTTLKHSVFDGDGEDAEYNTLVLRATSNHSWTYPLAEQRERAQYLRDPWVKETQRAMGHVVPRTKFAHLFLNELYWGIYVITERPDDAFMAEHFGKKKSKYDVIKGGEIVAGTDRVWRRLFALANLGFEDMERYRAFTKLVDMESFVDFMILNHFIGNETWDFGNWYAARHDSEGSRFQFFCWDTETSMARVGESRVLARNANRPTALFQALRRSEEFRRFFGERFRLHTTGDGALTPGRNMARYRELAERIQLAIVAEAARWGDYRSVSHRYRTGPFEEYGKGHWLAEKGRLLDEYFPVRTDILRGQYESIGLLE